MRVLAARLAAAFTGLFGSPQPFWPTWEEIVDREVTEQRERAAVAPPPAPSAPRGAADAPSEKTLRVMPAKPGQVTHLGLVDVTPPAAQRAARSGASASR